MGKRNSKGNPPEKEKTKIDIKKDSQIEFWCGKFGCSADELKCAVEEVGASAVKVEEFVNRR